MNFAEVFDIFSVRSDHPRPPRDQGRTSHLAVGPASRLHQPVGPSEAEAEESEGELAPPETDQPDVEMRGEEDPAADQEDHAFMSDSPEEEVLFRSYQAPPDFPDTEAFLRRGAPQH